MNDTIRQLQALEQHVQMVRAQKHALQSKLLQTSTAKTEIGSHGTCYKFVGNIMIQKNTSDISSQLDSQSTQLTSQIESLSKQEAQLVTQKKEMEEKVMGDSNE